MHLLDLPAEIFVEIFSFLSAKDLTSNVSRVCAAWGSYSSDEYIWKHYCLVRWGYLAKTTRCEKLDISWLSYFKSNFDKSRLSFLVLGAEGEGIHNERLVDVKKKVKCNGLVNVDALNVRTQAISLDLLRNYNAVMFFSYHGFAQSEIGDVLAEFVDLGGGVVICAYTNCGKGNRLEGRWEKGKYDPVALGVTSRSSGLRLGKLQCPSHPIMKGVQSLNGGEQSSHGDGPLHPSAKVIAQWSNGRPLVVELNAHKGTVVTLNMYPPSNDAATGGWDSSSHGGRLLANALVYVATKT